MGRRAADLTAPVPVLGVPALVGIRAWKTTEGERRGGALQHACVGVQTSPGISRSTSCLTDSLLDTITFTSSRTIHNKTEGKELPQLTKDDNEKKAILKQKCGDIKYKKEVTFKALRHVSSTDVTCQSTNSGTHCYTRAIKTNPRVAGRTSSAKAKFKSEKRYINGSVVDSEAVGGISVDNHEKEPVIEDNCYKEVQSQYSHHKDEPKTIQPLAATHPISVSQKICNHCGGRQSASIRGTSVGGSCLGKTPSTSAFATFSDNQPSAPSQIWKTLKIAQMKNENTETCSQTKINPQRIFLHEELKYRKIPHPACPVHSKGNMAAVKQPTSSTSVQLSPFANAKSITVTKATIEPRHNEHQIKLPQDTYVTMSSQMVSASKTNKITQHSYTYPRRLKSMEENPIQSNLPTDMCLSPQAVPVKNLSPPSYLCTRNNFSINTNQDSFNSPESSKDTGNATSAKHKNITPKSSKSTMTSALSSNQNESHCMPFIHDNPVIGNEKPKIKTSAACKELYINTLNHEAVSSHDSVQLNSAKPKVFVSTPSLLTSNIFKATTLKTKVSHHVSLRDTSQVKQPASLPRSPQSQKQDNHSRSNSTLYQSAQTHQVPQVANNRAKSDDAFGFVPYQQNRFCNSLLHISETQTLHKEDNKICDRNHSKSANNSDEEMHSKKNKLNDNLINKLESHESKNHKNSSLSQATNLENYISIIKSSSSCLQGCINSQQQKLERNYDYMKEDHRQQFESCPLVSVTNSDAESDTSVRHLNIKLEPNKQSSFLVKEQTNCEPVMSNKEKLFKTPVHQTSDFNTSPLPQAHTVPHHSFAVPNLFSTKRPHCAQGGPQSNSLISSSTTPSASHHHLRSCEAEAVIKADLYPSPAPPQLCPEETCLAHSHPSSAGLLLPPSPQCSKSAALQRRLDTVEASLAANKERITTLLNIIHDLEICRSPSSSKQKIYKNGKDVKNCSTCQKTACIVYSVEYDFRQQERQLLEILNCTAGGGHFFPTHHSQQSNCTLLRNVVMKHLAKTKVKSKKLCKTVFRWLPRKTMRV